VREAWDSELRDHFEEEERLLGPLLDPALLQRLIAEHRQIANQIVELPSSMGDLGNALHDHIRWEERVLFPWLEIHATEEQLADLEREANLLEVRRWETDARRKELVTRRWK
jgi:iron-sulfur cluster repair protein YtfE (RIC family)